MSDGENGGEGSEMILMSDLTNEYDNPHVMDVKLGIRTFLESEVT